MFCLPSLHPSPPPLPAPDLQNSTKPGSSTLCLKRALNFSFLNAGMLLSSSFAQTPWWRWMGARNTVIRKIKPGLVIFLYHRAVSLTSDVLHSARMSPEPLVPVVKKTIKNTIGERVMMKFNCSRSHTWGLFTAELGVQPHHPLLPCPCSEFKVLPLNQNIVSTAGPLWPLCPTLLCPARSTERRREQDRLSPGRPWGPLASHRSHGAEYPRSPAELQGFGESPDTAVTENWHEARLWLAQILFPSFLLPPSLCPLPSHSYVPGTVLHT